MGSHWWDCRCAPSFNSYQAILTLSFSIHSLKDEASTSIMIAFNVNPLLKIFVAGFIMITVGRSLSASRSQECTARNSTAGAARHDSTVCPGIHGRRPNTSSLELTQNPRSIHWCTSHEMDIRTQAETKRLFLHFSEFLIEHKAAANEITSHYASIRNENSV